MVESRILRILEENSSVPSFFGVCFGRFDYVFDIQPASPEAGFELLNTIRKEFFRARSFEGSFLSLLCFPMRSHKWSGERPKSLPPYRAYSVFRIANNDLSDILEALKHIEKKHPNIGYHFMWNPSFVSYLLKLEGESYDALSRSIIAVRARTKFARDFCTFMIICNQHTEAPKKDVVSGTINVKLGDNALLKKMIRYRGTRYRLGYFDLARDTKRSSPQALLKVIKQMRKNFRSSGPPNWTGTVLKFEKQIVLDEILDKD